MSMYNYTELISYKYYLLDNCMHFKYRKNKDQKDLQWGMSFSYMFLQSPVESFWVIVSLPNIYKIYIFLCICLFHISSRAVQQRAPLKQNVNMEGKPFQCIDNMEILKARYMLRIISSVRKSKRILKVFKDIFILSHETSWIKMWWTNKWTCTCL